MSKITQPLLNGKSDFKYGGRVKTLTYIYNLASSTEIFFLKKIKYFSMTKLEEPYAA